MHSNKNNDIFPNVNIDDILKKSINGQFGKLVDKKVDRTEALKMDESYVHEPKQFKQVSEFVSQKVKGAHVDLYKGYVDTLNNVSSKLDTVERNNINARHSDFRSLKLDESYNLNGVWLHELYFSNCFDPNSEIVMDSSSFIELQRTWGTFDDWQKDFIACIMACGNGWAVCGYNIFLKNFINTTISNNSQDVQVGLFPIVVIDCHEHSYFGDYKTDKKSYAVAMMRELNWEVIEERVKKAKSIAQAVK